VDERDAVNGAAAMIVFHDQLYAGSWGDGYLSQVWRSPDGLNWTDVITDGFGSANNGVTRFVVYSDTLYAGTWNGTTGTELWRSADGTTWEQFGPSGLDGTPDNGGAIANATYAGSLYWGTTNAATGGQIWRTDGLTLTAVITDGFGTTDNWGISSLASFDGYLYAGVVNERGAQVWRSPDGALDWTRVVSSSSISPTIGGENGLEVFAGHLYLVARNNETGLQVWRTANGTAWEQVGFAGLGDSDNQWSYWDNALLAFQDRLYLGTNNFTTGGQVWRLTEYKLYLPFVHGP